MATDYSSSQRDLLGILSRIDLLHVTENEKKTLRAVVAVMWVAVMRSSEITYDEGGHHPGIISQTDFVTPPFHCG